jgi:hypothetical protein
LANTMGLTWNKNISKGHQNDLSCAMRGIIKLITSELNGNTSTPANQKLYEIAKQNSINVPFARMPTIVKEPKPLPVLKPQVPAGPAQSPPTPVNKVLFLQSQPTANPIPVPQQSVEVVTSPKLSVTSIPAPQEPVNTIISKPAASVSQPTVNPIIPSIKKPTEKQDKTIKISEGISIIQQLKTSDNYEEYLDDIKNIIKTDYLKNTSSNHVYLLMKFYPNSQVIYDVLLALIDDRYISQNYDSTDLLGGSKLYKLHGNKEK